MNTQSCSTCHGEGRILTSLHSNDPHPRDEGPCPECDGCGTKGSPTDAQIEAALVSIKARLESKLNDWLCEMKPGYDDSIVGFNEAWNVMRKVFSDEWTRKSLRDALSASVA